MTPFLSASNAAESVNVNPSTNFMVVVLGIFGIETLTLGSFGRWIAAFTLQEKEESRVEVCIEGHKRVF